MTKDKSFKELVELHNISDREAIVLIKCYGLKNLEKIINLGVEIYRDTTPQQYAIDMLSLSQKLPSDLALFFDYDAYITKLFDDNVIHELDGFLVVSFSGAELSL